MSEQIFIKNCKVHGDLGHEKNVFLIDTSEEATTDESPKGNERVISEQPIIDIFSILSLEHSLLNVV